jgi:hypothetical protein
MHLVVSVALDVHCPDSMSDWPTLESAYDLELRVRADATDADAAKALALLTNQQLRSLALLARHPRPDDYWLALEFSGRAVTDRVVETKLFRVAGWTAEPIRDFVVWTAPTLTEISADQFAHELFGPRPFATTVEALHDLADTTLFGDLVPSRRGGSSALIALSGGSPGVGSLLLRNPAALELNVNAGEDSMCRLAERGVIRVAGVGAGSNTSASDLQLEDFVDPDAARRLWHDEERGGHSFWLIIEVEAVVDPPIGIPPGHIFEQLSVNGVQTLAVATSQSHVVNPGPPLTVVVPAWCLNEELAPPRGQPVLSTPLRARYTDGLSQNDVWADRARVLSDS